MYQERTKHRKKKKMKEYVVKVYTNGSKEWYLDGRLHREDGPAVERANGYKAWHLNGKLHREDGPAVEWSNGYNYWYLNGVNYTEEAFNAIMNPEETIEVGEHTYKLVK